jgi:dihydroflavonol-4-reductase
MKYVLTGATGFIGANLLRRLREAGHEVHCIIRKPNICVEDTGAHLHVVPITENAADVEKLSRIMDGCDGVFHVAGLFDPSTQGINRMVNLHVFGTRALLRAAEKAEIPRFITCSSSVTVCFGDKANPGVEGAWFDPTPVYGKQGPLRGYYNSKLQSEDLTLGWRGMDTIVLNPDYIIGPWDIKPTSGQLIVAMAKRYSPFYPLGGKCFLGAKDCADAFIAAMEKGRSGQRYLLGYHNLSYQEFMTKVSEVIGKRPPLLPLPNFALGMIGKMGELGAKIDEHRFAGLNKQVLISMQQDRYRSGNKMSTELGISPKPIEESIEAAYKWFVEHKYC